MLKNIIAHIIAFILGVVACAAYFSYYSSVQPPPQGKSQSQHSNDEGGHRPPHAR